MLRISALDVRVCWRCWTSLQQCVTCLLHVTGTGTYIHLRLMSLTTHYCNLLKWIETKGMWWFRIKINLNINLTNLLFWRRVCFKLSSEWWRWWWCVYFQWETSHERNLTIPRHWQRQDNWRYIPRYSQTWELPAHNRISHNTLLSPQTVSSSGFWSKSWELPHNIILHNFSVDSDCVIVSSASIDLKTLFDTGP